MKYLRKIGGYLLYCSLILSSSLTFALNEKQRLLVIDPDTPDYKVLTADLANDVRVLLLHKNESAFQQIASALVEGPVAAIHIISHAQDGQLSLAGKLINQSNIASYSSSLNTIKKNLTEKTPMLFYGCDLAATENGKKLLEFIAKKTGTYVAASIDKTGDYTLGGDWELEHHIGKVTEPVLFSEKAMNQYGHVLSHWRGGSITWRPVELDSDGQVNDVEILVKTACKLGRTCAPSALTNPDNIPSLTLVQSVSTTFSDYILEETYFTGKDLDPNVSYFVYYGGCCRIG